MIEQTVVKHDDHRDRILRKTLRIIQVVLIVLAGLALVFGFTVASVFWDTDRTVFWQALLNMILLALPVIGVAAFLEWRIQKLCVEYDYVLSDNVFSVFRVAGNRRVLWMTIPLPSLTFCKRYDELSEADKYRLSHVLFACCNADDPRLTLIESDAVLIGKRERKASVLTEPEDELFRAFARAVRGRGL